MNRAAGDAGVTLVFGASGYIGSNLVPLLVQQGRRVRAAARNAAVLEGREWSGVECVAADALRADTLPAVMRDVTVAYYLVHSMASGRDFARLDLQAAANFRDVATAAGVKRIVYLGGLIPEQPESIHLRSRYDTGQILRQGSVPVTEVRAGMIIGAGSAAFEVMRDLVNNLPAMVTPRWVRSRSPPIALPDLLAYLSAVADKPEAQDQIYDAAGPEVMSYAEVMRVLARKLGRRIVIFPVPVLTPRLSSYWLWLVTSVPVNIARALIDGLKQDVLANPEPLRQLIPQPLCTIEQAIEAALQAEQDNDVPAHWVEGSMRCRNFEPRYAYYAKQASGSCLTDASAAALWQQICSVGQDQDFFALNPLWWLRGVADWLLGGPSFRRKRRDPRELRMGDVVDAWRVIALHPQRKLTLLLEMKLPGAGVLEFEVLDRAGQREVRATAYFHPAGVWGLLYWYPLVPFHFWIFKAMTREIARRAGGEEVYGTKVRSLTR